MDRDATIIGYFGATKRGDVVCDGPACIVADPMNEKQFPSSAPQVHGLGKTWMKRGCANQFHKSRPGF